MGTAAAEKWTATCFFPAAPSLRVSDQSVISLRRSLSRRRLLDRHLATLTALPQYQQAKMVDLLEIERQMIHSHKSVTTIATSTVEAYAKPCCLALRS